MNRYIFFILLFSSQLLAQKDTYTNPVIPGGYPDPSICRVGEDYYLVNSSFEYFPGLPIHHSRDLVNWELIGYGLHRAEQCTGVVNLLDVNSNGGIHAPTIRFHNGLFYIITTNVYWDEINNKTDFINFIITAQDVRGPWSDPHHLEGAPGIDPDIFFDDDGKVWYVGTRSPENAEFPGQGEIWLQEIDLDSWKLVGDRIALWRGACDGVWVEGPHIYKRDGWYYLMVAEGGTGFDHAVMIAVSDKIEGPYISNARNPILSSRHLSYDHWVNSTGHADLVELPDGRWYMVALGIRGDVERRSNMGRETHLIPVIWEREPYEWKEIKHEWPVCSPITGKIERNFLLPYKNKHQQVVNRYYDDFQSSTLSLHWNFRRVPTQGWYSLNDNKGFLRVNAGKNTIQKRGSANLLGIRQTETHFEYLTRMLYQPTEDGVDAGICLFQKDENYLQFTLSMTGSLYFLNVLYKKPGEDVIILSTEPIDNYNGSIILKVRSNESFYSFEYSMGESKNFKKIALIKNNVILSKGYTGAYLGIYCTSNGNESTDYADFDWIRYNLFRDK